MCSAGTAAVTLQAAPVLRLLPAAGLLTWRCKACSRIIACLEWDGHVIEHRCKCSAENRLPDDRDRLRLESRAPKVVPFDAYKAAMLTGPRHRP